MTALICDLCPKHCRIEEGMSGDCRSRYNHKGVLTAITHDRPVAVHNDPIEKKPLYHVLPGSKILSIACAGCNLHCLNCQNEGISQANPIDLKAYRLNADEITALALKKGSKSIALTYTDPVIFYEYSLEIGKAARKSNLLTVWVTAGYINKKPLEEALPFIDAVNLDIKFMNDDLYRRICTGTLKPVLEAAQILLKGGKWLEITNLIIPGLNDSEKDIVKLIDFMKTYLGTHVPIHFSRFFPHHRMRNVEPTPESTILKAAALAEDAGMKYVYTGNIRGRKAHATTKCHRCHSTLIERRGYHVVKNAVINGKCMACNEPVHGLW